jgi:hypothetical protein
MVACPHLMLNVERERSSEHREIDDAEKSLVFRMNRMKMRRMMVTWVHFDLDPVRDLRDARHMPIARQKSVYANGCTFLCR